MTEQKISKSQIEEEIHGKGDFIQIDCLNKFLKKDLSMDLKKFIFLKLAEIYEKVSMLEESAKNYGKAGSISIPFSEKIKYFVKETEMRIKSKDFEKADNSMKKAMEEANSVEKKEIYLTVKDFYKKQAEIYEKEIKRANAARIYEKLLEMKIEDYEKREFKEKLLDLYDKLNKRKEYLLLKKRL